MGTPDLTPMHSFVKGKLAAMMRAQLRQLERTTGISMRTMEKIASGEIEDPSVSKIEILAEHFGYQASKRDAGKTLAAQSSI